MPPRKTAASKTGARKKAAPRKKAGSVVAVPVVKQVDLSEMSSDDEIAEAEIVESPIEEAKHMMAAGAQLVDPHEVVSYLERHVDSHPNVDGEVDRDTERFALRWLSTSWQNFGVFESEQRARWGLPPRVPQTATVAVINGAVRQVETTGWVPKVPANVEVTITQGPPEGGLRTAEQAWAQARAEGWVDR